MVILEELIAMITNNFVKVSFIKITDWESSSSQSISLGIAARLMGENTSQTFFNHCGLSLLNSSLGGISLTSPKITLAD